MSQSLLQQWNAGIIHIGNTIEEIALSEHLSWIGKHSDKPYVLLAQQSLFDASRVPEGRQTAWANCHAPNGSTKNMIVIIEQQIERFVPGFKDCILAKHVMNSEALEQYNSNYTDRDINGGAQLITQLFIRPLLELTPYKTAAKGIYIYVLHLRLRAEALVSWVVITAQKKRCRMCSISE